MSVRRLISRPLIQCLLVLIINLHSFTFSFTARGSEEKRRTARCLVRLLFAESFRTRPPSKRFPHGRLLEPIMAVVG